MMINIPSILSQYLWRSEDPTTHSTGISFLGHSPYFVVGGNQNYKIFELNFNSGSDTWINNFSFTSSTSGLVYIKDIDERTIFISFQVESLYRIRFQEDLTQAPSTKRIPLRTGNGEGYKNFDWTEDKSQLIITNYFTTTITPYYAYVVDIDLGEISKEIEMDGPVFALAVYPKTSLVIFGSGGSNPHKIYDFSKETPITEFEFSYERTYAGGDSDILIPIEVGYYLSVGNNQVRSIEFASGDMRQLIEFSEISSTADMRDSALVPNATFGICATKNVHIFIFNYKDLDLPYYHTYQGTNYFREISISKYYRLALLFRDSPRRYLVLKLPIYPCWSVCEFCDEFRPDQCLSCKANAISTADGTCECQIGYFEENRECKKCPNPCSSCSSEGCTGCKQGLTLNNNDQKCYCDSGYWSDEAMSCQPCSGDCFQCLDNSESNCLSCLDTFYVEMGKCLDCSEATEGTVGCEGMIIAEPERDFISEKERIVKLKINKNIENEIVGHQIDFSRVFKLSYRETGPNGALIPMSLTTVEFQSNSLLIKFDEFLKEAKALSIQVEIISPHNKFLNTSSKNYFFKLSKFEIKLQKVDEKNTKILQLESLEKTAQTSSKIITSLTTLMGIIASINGTSLAFLFKFFQVLEILSNFSKLNVDFSENLKLVFHFLKKLQFPRIPFIEKLSPIESSDGSKEVDLYLTKSRGSRPRLVRSNEDIFIFSGQNFLTMIIY